MSPEHPSQPNDSFLEFEQELAEIEQSLSALKEHYAQIKQSGQQQPEHLKGALQPIREKLEGLEVYAKFLLFNWSDAREPFWQAIRFGGLGVVLGWILKSCTG